MADVILRDSLIELTAESKTGEAVQIVPNIPMEVAWVHSDEGMSEYTKTQGYLVLYIQQIDVPGVGAWGNLLVVQRPAPMVAPFAWSASIVPSKPYLRAKFVFGSDDNHGGYASVIATYELLAEAIYNRLMRARKVTEKQIEACTSQVDEHEAAKVAASAKKEELELESALWDNYLSDEIAAYELLNPSA